MWHPVDPAVVGAVFTTESRQKNEAVFTRTHTPMNRVLVSHNRVGLENGQFVGEHEILQWIQSSAPLDSNRVWFVVGETGSGKSELCQWLEYHLRDRHLPLHVARRQANLTGILEVLAPHLPFDVVGDAGSLPLPVLTGHLQTHLLLRAHRERRYQGYIEGLIPHLPDIARHLYSGAPGALGLPPGAPLPPEGLPLSTWLSGAAREALGVQSLEPALRALAETAATRGQRPVLLLEDITTLGFLRDDLLDYIFDLSAPGFDAVIGLTSGFEQSHLAGHDLSDMAYVRDRLSARFQLSHESGETFFLSQPRDLHDLVRRYLSCLPLQTPAPSDAFEGLYPFTPTMLERLYLHLVEGGNARQTPRNLLDAVIRPALSLQEPPHVTCFRPHPYLKAPSAVFYRDGLSEDVAALYYWHGEVAGGHVHVPAPVAAAFGHPDLPPVQAFVQPAGSSHLFGGAGRVADPTADWRDALRELQQWHAQGAPFPKRQHLKRGISKIMRSLLEPRTIHHPHLSSLTADSLEFARGGDHLPIYLPDSGDVLPPGTPCLQFSRDLPAQFFEECLTYSFTSGQHAECFSDPSHTREVLSEAVQSFQDGLESHLAELLRQPFETTVFGMWWLCQHVCQGQAIQPGTLEGLDLLLRYDLASTDVSPAWQAERPHSILHRTHRAIREGRDAYRSLFISVFHHRDDLLDPGLLERCARTFDPTFFLSRLAVVPLGPLTRAPYRQGRSKRSLHALLKPMVDYAAALQNYAPHDEDVNRWDALLEALDQAQEQADAIDTVCRSLEQATHRLAWAVSVPPGSHHWRAPQWVDMANQAHRARAALRDSPPLTRITVARTWRERLEQTDPIQWMATVTAYHNAITGMLREQGLGRSGDRLRPGTVTLAHLQALQSRLDEAATLALFMPRAIAEQVLRAVHLWAQRDHALVRDVQQQHSVSDLNSLTLTTRDQALVFLSDLLTRAVVVETTDP